jgi:hypothetical protein
MFPVNWTHWQKNASKIIFCKQGFGWRKGAFMDGPDVSEDRDILWARGAWPWTHSTYAGMLIKGLLLNVACWSIHVLVLVLTCCTYAGDLAPCAAQYLFICMKGDGTLGLAVEVLGPLHFWAWHGPLYTGIVTKDLPMLRMILYVLPPGPMCRKWRCNLTH